MKATRCLLALGLIGACTSTQSPVADPDLGVDARVDVGGQTNDLTSDAPTTDAKLSDVSTDSLTVDTVLQPDASISDAGTACEACHGSAANAAPPLALSGVVSTTARGVGAHQQHLGVSSWHTEVRCQDCHVVPIEIDDPGHIDTPLPAETVFSALAKTDGASPAFNGTSCTGVYCHGDTLAGGSATSPIWTQVDGSQSTCSSCHGMPPTGGHSTSTNCVSCHPAVVDANQAIIDPSLHINGKVEATSAHPVNWQLSSVHGPGFYVDPDSCGSCHGASLEGGSAPSCATAGCHATGWKTDCTFCHGGTDNQTGAPPEAVDGSTAISVPGVGQHSRHVIAATHVAYGCGLCHGSSPQDIFTPGHIDSSPAEISFTALASGATYNFATRTCSNVYCHGNGKAGSTGSAVWTGSASAGCAACHDDDSKGFSMTLSGKHDWHIVEEGFNCATCHDCVVVGNKTIKSPTLHIDGKPDVCEMTPNLVNWNPISRRCTPACHEGESW